MSRNYIARIPERRDYYDVLADLPSLPEGTVPIEPHSVLDPVVKDRITGSYYRLNRERTRWVLADKD